ncbi:unnamed protein product [Ilex paraguariensis]|uniref:Stomatal closure-related actin-binding protein PH domain-containing protein n=1 Tax=Ilex paraguariensis TaxID=185542 RepID=A0ABC8V6W2_9AQUA
MDDLRFKKGGVICLGSERGGDRVAERRGMVVSEKKGKWRRKGLTEGANKSVYAPEPFDVGRVLQVDIVSNGQKATVTTVGPIDPAAALGSYVETLLRKSNSDFSFLLATTLGMLILFAFHSMDVPFQFLQCASLNESLNLSANKSVYAPEPFDVGRVLQVDIVSNGQKATVTTVGPIDPAAALGSYVETLLRKSNSDFSVVISQMNGQNYSSNSVHMFHVGKMRMKLCRGWITKARESYSLSMQLCGFRGGGNSAAKSLFWQVRKGQSFVLVFESERERNGAIMLARKYASDCNVMLAGPDDQTLL